MIWLAYTLSLIAIFVVGVPLYLKVTLAMLIWLASGVEIAFLLKRGVRRG